MEFNGFTNKQIEELWKEQKALDDEIRKNNGISETESLVSKKYIALKTELQPKQKRLFNMEEE